MLNMLLFSDSNKNEKLLSQVNIYLYWIMFLFVVFSYIAVTEEKDLIPLCIHPNAACSSLLKIGDDRKNVITDGTICNCSTLCPNKWSSKFGQVLEWYHHERVDWVLQFQFCHSAMPTRMCTPEEEQTQVATIKTNEDRWNPWLSNKVCYCKYNIYHVNKWEKVEIQTAGDKKGIEYWLYHFTCDSSVCKAGQACLKHHMDNSAASTKDYTFMCSCPIGYHCPVTIPEQKLNSYEMDGIDTTGPFVYGWCQEIAGWKTVAEKDTNENGFG